MDSQEGILQDGMLYWYLSQAPFQDAQVEEKINKEAVDPVLGLNKLLMETRIQAWNSHFSNRVQSSLVAALIQRSNATWTQNTNQELQFIAQVLSSPTNLTSYVQLFTMATACDAAVIAAATQAASNYTPLTSGNVAT